MDKTMLTFADTQVLALARQLCHRTEQMFDDPDLAMLRRSSPGHPAVERFDLLKRFLSNREMLRYPDDEEFVRAIAAMELDQNKWPVSADAEKFWSFLPNEETQRFVSTRLTDKALFLDLMIELSVWLNLRSNGLEAELVEVASFPDIKIDDRTSDRIFAEVKHVHEDTNLNRINQVIKKANRQIRNAMPNGSGLLFLKLSNSLLGTAYLEETPRNVQTVLDEVARRLHPGQFRHVSHVIVVWDTMDTVGDPPETLFQFSRRSIIIEHPAPHSLPDITPNTLRIEVGIEILVRQSPMPDSQLPLTTLQSGRIVRSAGFKEFLDKTGVIRSSHVVGARRILIGK